MDKDARRGISESICFTEVFEILALLFDEVLRHVLRRPDVGLQKRADKDQPTLFFLSISGRGAIKRGSTTPHHRVFTAYTG